MSNLIEFDFKLLLTLLVKSNCSNNASQIFLTLSFKSLERDDKIDCFSAFIINFVKFFENFCSNSEVSKEIKSVFVSNELFSKILSKILPFSLAFSTSSSLIF